MRIPHALILIVQVITFGIISVMLTPLEILKGRSEKDTSTKFFFVHVITYLCLKFLCLN